jgi:hypothetical protein
VVIITVIVLVTAFGVSFLHNWRLVEQSAQPKPVEAASAEIDADAICKDLDPIINEKLLQTRHKSVSFSVCVVDKEKINFDLDTKHVLLGLSGSMPSVSVARFVRRQGLMEANRFCNSIETII